MNTATKISLVGLLMMILGMAVVQVQRITIAEDRADKFDALDEKVDKLQLDYVKLETRLNDLEHK